MNKFSKTDLRNNKKKLEQQDSDFSKSWDCLEIEIDQRVWDRISACIDFRFASVTSAILVSVEQVYFVCLLRSVVCSWGDQDQHS